MPNFQTVQIVILALVSIALLANVALIIVILFSVGKMAKMLKDELADIRSSVMPMIYDLRELMTSISPKIESTADDVSAILHSVRSQSSAFESISTDVLARIKRQTARLDELLSGLMNTADRTSTVVADTVGRPIRRIAGLLASAKAVVDTLRGPSRTIHATPERDNRNTFV